MSVQAVTLTTCDRCGAKESTRQDSNPHESPRLPEGWQSLRILWGARAAKGDHDLCSECVAELEDWMVKAPEPMNVEDAPRRFAFFFAGLPHERKLAFVREALRGEYTLERVKEAV